MDPRDPQRDFLALDERFDRALAVCGSGTAPLTLLFSGGVDSSLIARGLAGRVPFELLTIGLSGSRDPLRAPSAALELGLKTRIVAVTEQEVSESLQEFDSGPDPLREPARSVQIALSLAIRAARGSRVLVGQGADELFGGYSHFRGIVEPQLDERRRADWDRLCRTDWPRSLSIASRLGKQLMSPFLDESFASLARGLPLEPVGEADLTKPFLRAWARHRGLPERIAGEPKLAMQYGSGVARAVRSSLRGGPGQNPVTRS